MRTFDSSVGTQVAASSAAVFDAPRLARTLAARRATLGLNTRQLAVAAGISQSYVVALEQPAATNPSRTSVPTIGVLARLAHALEMSPMALTAVALRPPSRHVLLVVDDAAGVPLAQVDSTCGPHQPEVWVWSSSDSRPAQCATPAVSIDLRRDGRRGYQPARVSAALQTELASRHAELGHRTIGLVFADTSRVMERLDDPSPVLRFEHRWHATVTTAANRISATPTWNVCVYERRALAALRDPLAATVDLLTSHDEGWFAGSGAVTTGRPGAAAMLAGLRPSGKPRRAWRTQVTRTLDALGAAGQR